MIDFLQTPEKVAFVGFQKQFAQEPESVLAAPGRVNLIGEHTDYNNGLVLPVAIDRRTAVAISRRNDDKIVAVSQHSPKAHLELSLKDLQIQTGWGSYLSGLIQELKLNGFSIGGANIYVASSIPIGTGLSSSAALLIALMAAFNEVFRLGLSGKVAAIMAQTVENNYVDCHCGIMDPLISATARQGYATAIDCKDYQCTPVELPENLTLMIVDSKTKRELASSQYNLRRKQCNQAAEFFGVSSLRDVSLDMLTSAKGKMDDLLFKRAKHVLEENYRVYELVNALSDSNLVGISSAMKASHESLRNNFEVTIPEIDALVNIIRGLIGDFGGVRMTGGGFGGCVVGLLPNSLFPEIGPAITRGYKKATGIEPNIFVCESASGPFPVAIESEMTSAANSV